MSHVTAVAVVCAFIIWLSVLTWRIENTRNGNGTNNSIIPPSSNVGNGTNSNGTTIIVNPMVNGIVTAMMPLAPLYCANETTTNNSRVIPSGSSVSLSTLGDGSVTLGSGTTIYIGAQQHTYGSYVPNHLSVVSLNDRTVLLAMGTYVMVGEEGDDWVTGAKYNFSSGIDPSGWHGFQTLPQFVDEVDLLSSNDEYALCIGVGGGGAFTIRVYFNNMSVYFGDHIRFVKGSSVDTVTVMLSPTTFAISYYESGPRNTLNLSTIVGSIDQTFNVTFGPELIYSPNHMFHQILAINSNLYALAYPNDDTSTFSSSAAAPTGLVFVTVGANNALTLWSADGRGAPWLHMSAMGYYFFDMTLLDRVDLSDGVTAVGAMAIVDRSRGDAISVLTFSVYATKSGTTYRNVRCVMGHYITLTQAGATIGYNYFAMQNLFSPLSFGQSVRNLPSKLKRNVVIAWQDTAKQGIVEVVVFAYAVESGELEQVLETTAITPPVPTSSSNHWWIAASSISHDKVMVYTTFGAAGNITIVEHRNSAIGITLTAVTCDNGPQSLIVALQGTVPANLTTIPAAGTGLPLLSTNVMATSRGELTSRDLLLLTTSFGQLDVIIGEDSCVGLSSTNDTIYFAPSLCSSFTRDLSFWTE